MWRYTIPAPTLSAQQEAPLSAQQQPAPTLRNTVNVQKSTIKLIQDAENPGYYLLAFSYDAIYPGSFSVFYFAMERNGSIESWNPKAHTPVRLPFEKGIEKKFVQASGTGIYLGPLDPSLLQEQQHIEGFPLVIRAQINVKEGQPDSSNMTEVIGAALLKSSNSQVTLARIERNGDGDCKVHVLSQTIWVDGVSYELKDLYGAGKTRVRSDYDEEDFGKECVICMSEPCDTAVMPCRHMCLCNDCVSTFESRTNRCPICREPVQLLMKFKF